LITFYLLYQGVKRIRSKDVFIDEKINAKWWVIGLSLFATDVSLSYVVTTAGYGFNKGLAVGSYNWTSSLVMVFVALYILPKYMRLNIKTLPEYLEMRYSAGIRLLAAILFVTYIVLVALSMTYYSFAIIILKTFNISSDFDYWVLIFIGIFSSLLLFSGGLKTAIRFDIFVAFLLIAGGLTMFFFSIKTVGGFDKLATYSGNKLSAILPADDNFIPWTEVFLGGLWLLHLNYWAYFQPMTQKMVSTEKLSEAQKGMLLTATLKLFNPFLFLLPGIVCYILFKDQIKVPEDVLPTLVKNIIPSSLQSAIILAFSISVISCSYAYLNAAAMIFNHDIYHRFISPKANEVIKEKIYFGSVLLFACIAILVAPYIMSNQKIFNLSLMARGCVLPGIISVFTIGLFHPYANKNHGWFALLFPVLVFAVLKYYYPDWTPVHYLGVNSVITMLLTLLFIAIKPNAKPILLLGIREIRFERNLTVVIWSIFIIVMVASIYVIF